nr:hypothetical protein [Tanacetum cinerariifolium]
EEPPKPHYGPIKTEVEEPLRLDIMYPHSHVASSVMGTNRTDKAHYGLRSLGPIKEEMVHVKKPYNMVKVTNAVFGLKASNSLFVCVGIKRLHDDLRVIVAQLVPLVYKVTTIFNKVSAASSRVTTAKRVTTAGWIKTKIAYEIRISYL